MRILGIDPGSQCLGWGLLEVGQGQQILRAAHGAMISKKSSFNQRIFDLSEQLMVRMAEWQPDIAVIEKIFLGQNADSAFKLGHIRGVCVVQCQKQGASIVEYSPREVKKIITGSGASDKLTLRKLLYSQLGIVDDGQLPVDASDALAMAFAYSLRWQVEEKLNRQRPKQL